MHTNVDPIGKLLDIQEQANDVIATSNSETAIDFANRVLEIIRSERW